MTSKLCGKALLGRRGARSPFAKLVAFDYDDGAVSGIVCCEGCANAYQFDELARDVDGLHDRAAWDRGEELRAYSLAPLPADAFDRTVKLISSAEAPNWPVWVPGIRQSSPHLASLIENEVAAILASSEPPTLLVATAGLLQPIVAVRDYPATAGQAPVDWFALLGFAADQRLVAST